MKSYWAAALSLLLLTGCAGSGASSPEASSSNLSAGAGEVTLLSGRYDFDGDGQADTVRLTDHRGGDSGWWTLEILAADGTPLWCRDAGLAHPAWGTVFACTVDGRDCLLDYSPYMSQGFAAYQYTLFALTPGGEAELLAEDRVEFDICFTDPDLHQSFDADRIAAFLEEVHRYAGDGQLLLSTQNGVLLADVPGSAYTADAFWEESCPYDETLSLAENLRHFEAVQSQS